MSPLQGELWLTDQALGSLLAAFAAAYAAALPLTAVLAERRPRPQLLTFALLLCAGGTLATSLGAGYWSLAAARAAAGAGADASTALAAGLLRNASPAVRRRAKKMAALAAPAGLALGYTLAGLIPGWRMAFALAALAMTLPALAARRVAKIPHGPDA